MSEVFDASAVLAALFDEKGADQVIHQWSRTKGCISSVNYCEVVSKLFERGMSSLEVSTVLEAVPLDVVPLEREIAWAAGELRAVTKNLGLSLGDRVCLALGMNLSASIWTADKLWKKVKGAQVALIR